MQFYQVWFTKLSIFYKTELINSDFLLYFHLFYHKTMIFPDYYCTRECLLYFVLP